MMGAVGERAGTWPERGESNICLQVWRPHLCQGRVHESRGLTQISLASAVHAPQSEPEQEWEPEQRTASELKVALTLVVPTWKEFTAQWVELRICQSVWLLYSACEPWNVSFLRGWNWWMEQYPSSVRRKTYCHLYGSASLPHDKAPARGP